MSKSCDVAIVGGGMVGLCVAHQLLERGLATDVAVIDKEKELGLHSSGRNSGVLHAGLYYKPESIKAKVCVSGASRLKSWIEDRGLPINRCGKLVVPQREELDGQLELLAERGRKNGATVEFWGESEIKALVPEARSASGRALWSPNTVVVKPLKVVRTLQQELATKGIRFLNGEEGWKAEPELQTICFSDGRKLSYGHLINCAGLQADRVAHDFGVGTNYKLLPFKGLYWQLKRRCPIQPKCNLYPVPDLNVPFLGVHFTPSADETPVVSIGPTATPAWGRENYRGLEGIEPIMAAANIGLIGRQYMANKGGFRRYVHEQALLAIPQLLLRASQELIPSVKAEHIELSSKVGIRSQLFNQKSRKLEDDFICLKGHASTHVLNAISPAFTASFALADLILDRAIAEGSLG